MTLTITAWNVRQGGGDQVQRIVQALEHLQTDIAVVSEWRATSPNGFTQLLAEAGYSHQVAEPDPSGGYASVLVASKRPITKGEVFYGDATDGHRFQHVDVLGTSWSIAAAYVPGFEHGSDRKERFWRFLLDRLGSDVANPTLLCGDLNTGLHYRDELGATFRSHQQQGELERAGWRDAWIERNPTQRPPGTWFSPQYNNPFRLDHALLSPAAPRAVSVDYPSAIAEEPVLGAGGLSDHLPLVVRLQRSDTP